MPTIPSIRTSVENQKILILDEHAKNGIFKRDTRGRLVAYAGGFSVVFPYETASGDKWAFRCWHSMTDVSNERYKKISEAVNNSNLDFLYEFIFVEKGILVDGGVYPTSRMRWVDGILIKDYICQNRDSKEKLDALAEKFLAMTKSLHDQFLAHGDLQHGNILVGKDEKLCLVDYDSFYCPELKGKSDAITGLPDYQHPARNDNKVLSEKIDYFSELVIYLSIKAIAENPSLVEKYKVEDSDRLLFAKEDYADIKHSEIYKDIQSLGKDFQDLLDILEDYLKCTSIDQLSPFETYLWDSKVKFSVSSKKVVRKTQAVDVKWEVPFDATVSIGQNGKKKRGKFKNDGQFSTKLSEDTTFTLAANAANGRKITKNITVRAFDKCSIDFTADKRYSFPSIPVKLSWNVKHAKKVWLDSVEVKPRDSKIVEPTKPCAYILTAQDEFGKTEKRIEIEMLPTPYIKGVLVPTPNISCNTSISIRLPRMMVDVKMPTIEVGRTRMKIPKIHLSPVLNEPLDVSPLRLNGYLKSVKMAFGNLMQNLLRHFRLKKSGQRVNTIITKLIQVIQYGRKS